jgi:hypothetical protein
VAGVVYVCSVLSLVPGMRHGHGMTGRLRRLNMTDGAMGMFSPFTRLRPGMLVLAMIVLRLRIILVHRQSCLLIAHEVRWLLRISAIRW